MKIIVNRDISTPRSLTSIVKAIPLLRPEQAWQCYGLEPFWDPTETIKPRAILPGTYSIKLQWSPKRQRIVPWLLDVKNFDAVEIHWGNFEFVHEDAQGKWHLPDSDACLVVGAQRGLDSVLVSMPTFDHIFTMIYDAEQAGEDNTITYINAWEGQNA